MKNNFLTFHSKFAHFRIQEETFPHPNPFQVSLYIRKISSNFSFFSEFSYRELRGTILLSWSCHDGSSQCSVFCLVRNFSQCPKNFLFYAALLHNGGFCHGYITKQCKNKSANGSYNVPVYHNSSMVKINIINSFMFCHVLNNISGSTGMQQHCPFT